MGMDSYIYKTTKKEYYAYTLWKENCDKNVTELKEYEEAIKLKYGNDIFEKNVDEIIKIITNDELIKIQTLIEATHKEYDIEGYRPRELCYWRKAYGIHRFICRNFLEDGVNPNCIRIPLSKENIQSIINEMKRCKDNFGEMSDDCIFGSQDYWDIDDLNRNISFFQNLHDNEFSDECVIYYYTWY